MIRQIGIYFTTLRTLDPRYDEGNSVPMRAALCNHVDTSRTRSICMPSRSDPTAAGSAVQQQVIGKLLGMPRLERNKMKSEHLIFVGIFLSIFI